MFSNIFSRRDVSTSALRRRCPSAGKGGGEQTAYIVKNRLGTNDGGRFWMDQGFTRKFRVSRPRCRLKGKHLGSMIQWSTLHFADFAFDLLALLKGTFERGTRVESPRTRLQSV